MWNLKKSNFTECDSVQDVLQYEMDAAGNASTVTPIVALGTLLAKLPAPARDHVAACSDCRIFAEELFEVRDMFQAIPAGPQPGPFFLKRVMASIASREAELERKAQTWAAVPRLASRLSVLASLTLLIAGSWLYERPAQPSTVAGISAEQYSEGLVDGSPIQDDFLLNPAGK